MGLEEAFDFVFSRSFTQNGEFPRYFQSLRAFEMWRYEGVEDIKIVNRELKHNEVDAWLETRGNVEGEGHSVETGLKMLFCETSADPTDADCEPTPEEEVLSSAVRRGLDKFDLSTGWDWNWQTLGMLAVPHSKCVQPITSSPSLRYRQSIFNMQCQWRYEQLHRTTIGIHLAFIPTGMRSVRVEEITNLFYHCSDLLSLAIFPSLPILLAYVAILLDVKKGYRSRQETLERSTGFSFLNQEYKARDRTDRYSHEELSVEAAALVSGFATLRLRLAPMLESIKEIQKQSQAWREQFLFPANGSESVVPQLDILDAWLDYIHGIVIGHKEEISTWILRAENQLSVLYNLITQRDQRINMQLAKDSRTLAIESKRDSVSMKTLAAVTMIFLPGTFIASLFSIPVFDWRADPSQNESVIQSRFWVYWAVTIPITIATMIIWYLWFKYSTTRHEIELSSIMLGYESDIMSYSSCGQNKSYKASAAAFNPQRSNEAAKVAKKPSKHDIISKLLPARRRHAEKPQNVDLP